MSQHRSLRASNVGAKQRNVLKRYERIKAMMQSEQKTEIKAAYGLPKLRVDKIKGK